MCGSRLAFWMRKEGQGAKERLRRLIPMTKEDRFIEFMVSRHVSPCTVGIVSFSGGVCLSSGARVSVSRQPRLQRVARGLVQGAAVLSV